MTGMSVEDKIIKARVQMISKAPFYGTLVMNLNFKEADPREIPTCAVTPYGTVYYNREYIENLTLEELKGVLVHEVLHVALLHLERRGTRNIIKANMAMDYAVNLIVEEDFSLPKGVLLDHKYQNMAWEQIYDQLPDPELCDGDCSKCPLAKGMGIPGRGFGNKACRRFGSFDKHITRDELERAKEAAKSGASSDDLKKLGIPKEILDEDTSKSPNWRKIMSDAYNYAKNAGNLPAGLERLVDEFSQPQISWKELLSQYVSRSIPYNFTYRRCSRKSIVSGHYFPSLLKEMIEVMICVDTSGSINEDDLREFMGEILGLLRSFERVEITLMSCDTQLYQVNKVSNEYDLRASKLVGGGGTSFRPVFKYLREEKKDTKILVYFTDCYGDFPDPDEVPSGLTVIWVVTRDGNPEAIPEYFPYVVQLK